MPYRESVLGLEDGPARGAAHLVAMKAQADLGDAVELAIVPGRAAQPPSGRCGWRFIQLRFPVGCAPRSVCIVASR